MIRDTQYAIRSVRWTLALLLIVFVALGITYSIITPIFEASDELWHYPVVQYIAAGHGLPVQTPPDRPGLWKQQASQPPLYYALAALLTCWIDTGDLNLVLRPNPHAAIGVVTPDGNINMVAHDPTREAWPWRGTVLAVHLTRLLSVAMSTAAVYLTYRLGREAFPDRPEIALAAAAFTAFTPMFIFISGSVNNDNLAVPLCALALLLMLRQLREARAEEHRLMVGWLALGVVIGLAVLTKLSGVLLLLPAALAVGQVARQRANLRFQLFSLPQHFASLSPRRQRIRASIRHLVAASLALGLPVLALTGWWFWRNWQLYGDPTGLKMFNPYFTRAVPADLAQIWSERTSFLYGYWGNFGGLNLPIPSWAYTALNVLMGLAVLGLFVAVLRFVLQRMLASLILRPFAWLKVAPASPAAHQPMLIIALWGVVVFIGWVAWTRTTWSSQGRLVFYALPVYSILMAAGLATWLPRRIASFAFGVLGTGMALLSAAMPFMVIAPAYARPSQLTSAQMANIPHRLDVTFGDALVLLGYDAPVTLAHPGETVPITLYWQALGPMERDYSVFVHLLDENDIEVQDQNKSQAYPGRGNLPTTTLAPGQTWAETWVMPIQSAAYAPARLIWEVGLFDMASTQKIRLPVTDQAGQALGDSIRFGQIELVRQAGSQFNPVSYNFGDQMELIGFELNRRTAAPGETVDLILYWRAPVVPVRDYTIFAHVLGEQQTKAAALDMQPSPPTSSWKPGQVISSTHPLKVQAVPPGVYDIMVGVYHFTGPSGLERLKILTRDGRQQQDYVLLGKLRVR